MESNKLLKVDKGEKPRDERHHGALLVLNELVRCSNADWERNYNNLMKITDMKQDIEEQTNKPRFAPFSKRLSQPLNLVMNQLNTYVIESSACRQLVIDKYDYICLDVLNMKSTRSAHIQQSLLMILPRLAAFKKERFIDKYLAITMNHLFTVLRSREKVNITFNIFNIAI